MESQISIYLSLSVTLRTRISLPAYLQWGWLPRWDLIRKPFNLRSHYYSVDILQDHPGPRESPVVGSYEEGQLLQIHSFIIPEAGFTLRDVSIDQVATLKSRQLCYSWSPLATITQTLQIDVYVGTRKS